MSPQPTKQPTLKQGELILTTAPSGQAARPQCVVAWDPLAEGEFDPNSRYPEMVVDEMRLSDYLHARINKAIRGWQRLPNTPESRVEAVRIKDSCLQAIVLAHAKVMRPGMDRSALSHATALCANAVRTVTVLCNFLIDWPDNANDSTPTARRERELCMSRFFAGIRSYNASQLPRGMLPFGTAHKLTPIRRETPDDPRLLANIFAGSPKVITDEYEKLLQRLRGPAMRARLSETPDGEEDDDGIREAQANYLCAT